MEERPRLGLSIHLSLFCRPRCSCHRGGAGNDGDKNYLRFGLGLGLGLGYFNSSLSAPRCGLLVTLIAVGYLLGAVLFVVVASQDHVWPN